jgi:hypothetical protein
MSGAERTRRSPFLGIALLIAATGAAAVFPSVALADHRPPTAVMNVEHRDHSRRGLLYSFTWARPLKSGLCEGTDGDGIRHWKHPLRVRGGHLRTHIDFHIRQRPHKLELHAWRRLDKNGDPIGRGHDVSYRLLPRKHHGAVRSWRARFRVTLHSGHHYYLDVDGHWRDSTCKVNEEAQWTFGLKAKSG